jgi:ABC-type transporter Mla subunit MlaD
MDSLNKFETALSGFETEIKNFQKLAETQKQLGNIQKDCHQLLINYQIFSDSVKTLLANYEKFRSNIEATTNKVATTNASFIAGVETKIATFETTQKENFTNLESKNRAQIEEKFEQLKHLKNF